MSKRGLGRGIEALITPVAAAEEGDQPAEVQVHDIVPNKFQPRRVFDEEQLNSLAQSIKQHGILQPIVVRPIAAGFELVAGERRWRAAQLAGLTAIPAVVRDYNDKEMTEIALVENLQRQDLNPIEEAQAFQRLMEEFELTQEEVAKKVGRSRPMIANTIRLLNLLPEVQDFVSRGTLSMGQARPLLGLEDAEMQQEAARIIIDRQLSARDAEEMVRRMVNAPRPRKAPKTERQEIFLVEAEEQLQMLFGTQVKIKPGKLKSKIEIEFYSIEDLERIVETLIAREETAATRTRGTLVV
jgi:ParB family transcriptional regulator, chromosome partitioning protein